ncbi:TetR/AcrR family transcriptional regulator [Pontimicrobium aquaticum]|uniref:TetR/AcrR family transcriptional regulator n=1 Tax=Pontimicrobium aquaticum TaxID=2565367 RepID=A0A4U0EW58_9FLAO|nr:TetR/AcrR family transcriptional regulator [Pontimicrobium aquaticum]TJY36177.1 TetR/AcrR family transcriptional regulator [Pontimicrobium aquaticum]
MNVRTRILKIAKQKFLKYGFYKVSMDSLVKELRTSKSSLYNHFSSKDELVKAVIDQLNIEINSALQEIVGDDKLSFKGKLIEVSKFTKNLLTSVSEAFLKDLELNTPHIWDYYQQTRIDRINNYYRKLFEIGINEGMLRNDIDINVILTIYMNLMELPLKSQYQEFLGIHSQNIYELTTEIFLNGITEK